MKGWIGVDLDGTLAHYDGWVSPTHIGPPVHAMLERVKGWLAQGYEVRIFTARIWPALYSAPGTAGRDAPSQQGAARPAQADRDAEAAIDAVRAWVKTHVGQDLALTCVKDTAMVELWDDRAVQVTTNTGWPVGHSTRGL